MKVGLMQHKWYNNDKSISWGILAIAAVLIGVFVISSTPEQQQLNESGTAITGPTNAPILMTEYGDFQCPSCAKVFPTLSTIKKEYRSQLQFTFVHYPLKSIHKNAYAAALASEAAKDQGKFWEMHDMLYTKQAEWSNLEKPDEKFLDYAKALALDTQAFTTYIKEEKGKEKIESDITVAQSLGIKSTPTFDINGILFSGVPTYDQLRLRFEQILAHPDITTPNP
jgi:protein-disulfide isomerase